MGYRHINDYGIIGDMTSCALVDIDGAIDWACFPRFDSPSVFAAILDSTKGGRLSLTPSEPNASTQRYLPDTTVLETTFTTQSGKATLTDFMTSRPARAGESPHEIIRILHGVAGTVQMRLVFQPRLDYARTETEVTLHRNGVSGRAGSKRVALVTKVAMALEQADDGGQQATANFELQAGETVHVVSAYGLSRIPSIGTMDCDAKLARAKRQGHATAAKIVYDGRWRDEVVRSFLTLHLLTYQPTGAIIAAPTTSLPESIGGQRNWDYRYSWLRDSAWTVGILFRLGDPHEGEAFMDWIVKECWLSIEAMQVLYGIAPESELEEHTLDHFEGYRGSAPVRIGNGAAFHRQLDVFGEIALSLATYHKYNGSLPQAGWDLLFRVANLAAESWHLRDNGIWEVRGELRHFVSSKVMCWLALDRAAHLAADTYGHEAPLARWREEAEKLHADILANGWSDEKQSFVQAYGSDVLDASALLIPFVGFLPNDDPRVRSTVKAVQRELATGPFVRRYNTEEADDGFEDGEGAFYMLSFWLIGALLAIGETKNAEAMFDEIFATANHLGLFAEMFDPVEHEALGNFPQAFSHIAFIHTARNLSNHTQTPEEDLLG